MAPDRAARAGARANGSWSWARLLRIAALLVALLAGLDRLLAGREDEADAAAPRGALRNAAGVGIADACRRMLLERDPREVRRAVVMVGSSVSYGAGLDPTKSLPAVLHARLAASGETRPVFNCAAAGGAPTTPIPVAAALGEHGAALLLVEVLSPSYVAGRPASPGYAPDEQALLLAASSAQRRLLVEAGHWPRLGERAESAIGSTLRRAWRLYRIRGSLWIDDELTPNLLIWTLRREAARVGLLPKRFHGQTTNVGELPWREAYVGDQRPAANQRFFAPSDEIDEGAFAALLQVQSLAAAAGTPLLFYDVPLNLEFQRHFALMTEEQIARLTRARERLLQRMRSVGMQVEDAPLLDDAGFLDKAHVTPAGAEIQADHLLPAVVAQLRD